jgi:hypothetical protein
MRPVLLLALLAAVAAGCGGVHAAAPGATSTSRTASLARAWHQVVLCARAHGLPNLQDPQIDPSGKAIFPNGLTIPPETRRACQSMANRLIPDAAPDQPPTAAQLASLRAFAQCLRQHGVPNWPDPNPDGSFSPPPEIAHSLKSLYRSQLDTCSHLKSIDGISISQH